jgi:hypothetical protein
MIVMNLVTPKAAAELELLFKKLAEASSLTSKFDLSCTTQHEEIHNNDCYEFGHS